MVPLAQPAPCSSMWSGPGERGRGTPSHANVRATDEAGDRERETMGDGQRVLTPEPPLIESTMTYAPSGREACCPKGGHVAWPEALVN